jgi:predicted DNA-binding protein (MmcQ/YjbR family)
LLRREDVFDYCGGRPGATEEYPFGDSVAVFKVGGKIFAICSVEDDPPQISLKCDPLLAEALRASHPAVRPGYHLNKRHWNTVTLDGSVSDDEIEEWIDHSYDLIVAKLPRREEPAAVRRRGAGRARGPAGGDGRAR